MLALYAVCVFPANIKHAIDSVHKPFRVRRDAGGSDTLASFDTLEDAVRNVRRRRGDCRYVIHDGRKIVWPESRAKVE